MGKNHGLNLVFIDAGIFLLTGIREWRKYDDARKAKRKEGE